SVAAVSFPVRTIEAAELRDWFDALSSAYFLTADPQAIADFRRPQLELDRAWAAYDGDRIIATLRTFATELTLPGGAQLPADAVTSVATMPTQRRRGALTAMMTASLDAAVKHGDPLSILIAARWPIYGRYGFGPATELAEYSIDTVIADFGKLGRDGPLEFVDAATGRALAPALFDRFRRVQSGAISRTDIDFDRDFGKAVMPGRTPWAGRVVVHRPAPGAEIDGFLRYHVDERWENLIPKSVAVVDDLVAITQSAYAALWKLCCDLDNVASVTAANRSVDEALPWMLVDARAMVQVRRSDIVWLRLLDVETALSARRYLATGSLVIEVRDAMGYATGRYELNGGPDAASCTRTTKSADIELTATTLGSAYLAGMSLQTMAAAGLVIEHRAGAVALADAMFRWNVVPWCNTWF
ncbi:MAG TPA: GNAT family N-acetyltransferase, partial [Acidothermaceae bacterium]